MTSAEHVATADGSDIIIIVTATEPGFHLSIMNADGEQIGAQLDANEASALATLIARATF